LPKLIRDSIPAIARRKGKILEIRIAEDHEMPGLLGEKLLEETSEFLAEPSIEELIDILEVVEAIATAYGWSPASVEAAKAGKKFERGAFAQRVVLLE
jgi:predicted house-cleaning noncanonical NTP pyrophosphatase (MazG superfamily)